LSSSEKLGVSPFPFDGSPFPFRELALAVVPSEAAAVAAAVELSNSQALAYPEKS